MYDVLLLSIEQPNEIDEKLSYGNLTIETMNHFGDIREKYYFEKWPFLNNLNGILYRIYTEDQFGEFQCGDGLFQFKYESEAMEAFLPYWYHQWEDREDLKNDLIPISIKKEFWDSFQRLIDLMLEKSPLKTILFLCCGQSLEREIIYGKITKDVFYNLLETGSIATNICYIIGLN